MKRFFVRDGRLRSGWRVALYLAASVLSLFLLAILIGLFVAAYSGFAMASESGAVNEINARIGEMFARPMDYPLITLGAEAVRVLVGLGMIFVLRRCIDKRSFRSLGFQFSNGWWREFGAGFALAGVMWVVIFALSFTLGAVSIAQLAWNRADVLVVTSALVTGLLLNVLVGVIEEADARGYILQNLEEGIRFTPAVVVSSAYFGVLHLLNPSAGVASTLGIFVAGILLSACYALTRRLWLPIGLHAGWNFFQGPVFGYRVSGLDMGGLFELNITAPEWLLGGAFGPEAGALAVGVEVAAVVGLVAWARKQQAQ